MCGPCEGYLFPGIFMHQLLPDRRRFGFGRISFIALAKDIEKAGMQDSTQRAQSTRANPFHQPGEVPPAIIDINLSLNDGEELADPPALSS